MKQETFNHFNKAIAVFLIVSVVIGCKSNDGTRSEKAVLHKESVQSPNILFAIADDHSFPHTGIYGFKEIKTPAFDQVAKNGILFNNAFVGAPQCSPSRAAILPSRNIWQLEEAGTHGSSFPKKFTVFTDLLEDAGYKLGYTGKPWGPGNYEREGWERNPVGPAYNDKVLPAVPASGINARDYYGNFETFMTERKSDEPFFFWYGGHEPHRVYEYGSGLKSGKRLDQVEVPKFLPDNEITKNDMLDYLMEIEYFDAHLGKMLLYLEKNGELENTLVVVTADNGMPFPYAKANLQEYGTHVPLAISWPNGIKRYKETDALVSLIDLAPTFLEIAGLKKAPGMTGKSMLPILKTEGSEESRSFVLTGRERHTHARPENLGYPARALRTQEYLIVKNYDSDRWPMGDPVNLSSENDAKIKIKGFKALYPGYHDIDASPSKTFMMDHRQYPEVKQLFINAFEKRESIQLYDIKNDPECIHDLSQDPAFAIIKGKLNIQLNAILMQQGDPRMSGSSIFDSYPRYSTMRNFDGFNTRGEYNPAYQD